jgi:hypothetical protein
MMSAGLEASVELLRRSMAGLPGSKPGDPLMTTGLSVPEKEEGETELAGGGEAPPEAEFGDDDEEEEDNGVDDVKEEEEEAGGESPSVEIERERCSLSHGFGAATRVGDGEGSDGEPVAPPTAGVANRFTTGEGLAGTAVSFLSAVDLAS